MFDDLDNEDHWIPLADVMTTMMMVMMLIALFYITFANDAQIDLQDTKQKYKQNKALANKYKILKSELYQDLDKEFQDDLATWHAVIVESTLSIKFLGESSQFNIGSSVVSSQYKLILEDFFPRYIAILNKPKYADSISEIRVEGYSSSLWKYATKPEIVYLNNMKLSQDRAFNILEYIYSLDSMGKYVVFLNNKLTSNGMSYSHNVYTKYGSEDTRSSQRIEFKINLNSDSQIINQIK